MERGKLNQFVMFSKEMVIWFSDLACLVLFESLRWLRKTLIKGLLRVLLQLTIKSQLISKVLFGVIVWTKNPTKLLKDFCPSL